MKLYTRKARGPWWVAFSIDGHRYRFSTRLRNKRQATRRAEDIIQEAERKHAAGRVYAPNRARRLSKLIREYRDALRQRGRSASHISLTIYRIERVLEGIDKQGAATPERITKALARIAEEPVERAAGDARPPSPRTVDYYRVATNGFFRWLQRRGVRTDNPVASVDRRAHGDLTYRRRPLTEAQLQRLVQTSRTQPLVSARKHRIHAGVTPREETRLRRMGELRSLVYLVAARQGLRRGECRALAWRDVDLKRGTITIRASTAKSRREATLPLCDDVRQALLKARGGTSPTGRVFRSLPSTRTLRRDLKAARIPAVTEEGVVDFHSLRHTTGTLLARAGVAPQLTQEFMRHANYATTQTYYTHLRLDDLRGAAEALGGAQTDCARNVPRTGTNASLRGTTRANRSG